MSTPPSFRLFSVGSSILGTPTPVNAGTFKALGALELRDIERWVRAQPDLLGEDLMIVSAQLADNDRFRDRLDLLAVDRAARLVVVELKRDDSGSSAEMQAIKYAARVSTLTADDVAVQLAAYLSSARNLVDETEARALLEAFVTDSDPADPLGPLSDEDVQPRIILASGQFRPDVTATVLFLRRFDLDVTCVQLTPFETAAGEVLLASTVLIPLREAKDFEQRTAAKRQVSQQRKSAKKLTPEQRQTIRDFIAAIPDGRWAAYVDVAEAIGNRQAAMGMGSHLKAHGGTMPNVYRILSDKGEVRGGWTAASPGLPPTPEAVVARLKEDGVNFPDGRADQDQRFTAQDWYPQHEDAPPVVE